MGLSSFDNNCNFNTHNQPSFVSNKYDSLFYVLFPKANFLSHMLQNTLSLSLTHSLFLYFSYLLLLTYKHTHTHWAERKQRWVMRIFGSPLCHHGDTEVPPTGCVTSKECPSLPSSFSLCLPPTSLFPFVIPGQGDDGIHSPPGRKANVLKHTSHHRLLVCECGPQSRIHKRANTLKPT